MEALSSLRLAPLLPTAWITLVTLALLGLLAYGCVMLHRRRVPLRWIAGLAVLRGLCVLVFAACMLGPVFELKGTRQVRPPLLVLVDQSRSMARQDLLPRLIAPVRSGALAEHLRSRYDVHWYGFDHGAQPLTEGELADLTADGDQTRVAQSLDGALRHFAGTQFSDVSAGAVMPRVLLLSDGVDLSRSDPAIAATQHHAAVDVMLLPPGDAPAAEQLQLVQVLAPTRIMLGAEAQFRLTLRRTGAEAMRTTVQLLDDGREVRRVPVSFDAGKAEQDVLLSYRPEAAGTRQIAIQLPDVAAHTLAVQVLTAQHEVLVLEDRWRWEFRYLRRVLEDDPAYHMTAILPRGSQSYVHFAEPTRRVSFAGFPQGEMEIDWFDLIVLGDVDPSRWPANLAQAIASAVTDRGAGLVFIAGPRLAEIARHPVLGALLPVQVSGRDIEPIQGPLRLRVAAEAGSASLFSVHPETATPLRPDQLPPVEYLYPVDRKQPAATVLLEAAGHANAFGPLIAMAEQPVGRGRVLLIATDTLWKWQTDGPIDEQGQTLHQRFWQQALRSLTPVQGTTGAAALRVVAQQSRVRVNDSAELSLHLIPAIAGAEVKALMVDPSGASRPLTLTPSPAEPGAYATAFRAAAEGPYRVEAQATLNNQAMATGVAVVQCEPAVTEDSPQPPDPDRLAALAHATGGKVIDPANADTWPGREASDAVTVQTRRTVDLWRNFSLLLLLAGLLGADWMLRMMRGYV